MRNALNNRKPLKKKKCRECPKKFQPVNSLQVVCSPICAIKKVENDRQKKAKRELKVLKADTRKRKKDLKTKRDWLPVAQVDFNAYIRWRDRHEPCISCGRHEHEITERFTGGIWDCGHYLTRGAYPELRFSELNAAKQCKSCNGGAGKYVRKNLTVTKAYRVNLIDKIGLKAVEWLEGPHRAQNWVIQDVIDIRDHYKQMLKYEMFHVT